MKETPAMALTKSHLIDAIAEQNAFTRKKSTETVEIIFEIIKSRLDTITNLNFSQKEHSNDPRNRNQSG
jgi:nucleoid DNA-binding protein